MQLVDELAAIRDCERLVYDFSRLVDSGRRPEVPGLFADQGTWRVGAQVVTGREELATYFAAVRDNGLVSRHVVTNVSITVRDTGSADGHSLILWFSFAGDSPDLNGDTIVTVGSCQLRLGEYRDEFIHTDKGWRFLNRERRYVLLGGDGHPDIQPATRRSQRA
jgi:hypothetical protein